MTPPAPQNSTESTGPTLRQVPRRSRQQTGRLKTGCSACRRRRKKCGEERPRCKNCERLGLECDRHEAMQLRTSHIQDSGCMSAVFTLRPQPAREDRDPGIPGIPGRRVLRTEADGGERVREEHSRPLSPPIEGVSPLRKDDSVLQVPIEVGATPSVLDDVELPASSSLDNGLEEATVIDVDDASGQRGRRSPSTDWYWAYPLFDQEDMDSTVTGAFCLDMDTSKLPSPWFPLRYGSPFSPLPAALAVDAVDGVSADSPRQPSPLDDDQDDHDDLPAVRHGASLESGPDLWEMMVSIKPEDELFGYFVDFLCPLISNNKEPWRNDYVLYLVPLSLHPYLYPAVIAFSAEHLSLSVPSLKPLARSWCKRAQEAAVWAVQVFGAGPCDGDLVNTLLLALILLNSIDITDGAQAGIGQRLRQCKGIIQGSLPSTSSRSDPLSWIKRNIAYHDVLCTSSMLSGDITVSSEWWTASDSDVDTMMGACQPIFRLVGKLGQLSHIRRLSSRSAGSEHEPNSDLDDIYVEAKFLEDELDALECPVQDDIQHQTMFEMHRCAARLFLYNTVYGINAASLVVQGQVSRIRSLRLALTGGGMGFSGLPGVGAGQDRGFLHTSHWIIFNAAVNSVSGPGAVRQDYACHMRDYPFENVKNSLDVVEKVWRMNKKGTVAVNWLDVLEADNVELIFV